LVPHRAMMRRAGAVWLHPARVNRSRQRAERVLQELCVVT
jgi:hypothetical protein